MLGTGKVEAGKGILYQIRAKRLRLGFFVFVRTGPPYRSPACRCRLVLFLPSVSFSFFYFRSPDSSAACPIFYRLPFVFVLLPPCTHCFRNSSLLFFTLLTHTHACCESVRILAFSCWRIHALVRNFNSVSWPRSLFRWLCENNATPICNKRNSTKKSTIWEKTRVWPQSRAGT